MMSGKDGGVQALIKKAGYVNAAYVQCAPHRLNSVLSATAERHSIIKSFFDTSDLTYTFMAEAKRHTAFSDIQRERYPVLWYRPTERHESCFLFSAMFP